MKTMDMYTSSTSVVSDLVECAERIRLGCLGSELDPRVMSAPTVGGPAQRVVDLAGPAAHGGHFMVRSIPTPSMPAPRGPETSTDQEKEVN